MSIETADRLTDLFIIGTVPAVNLFFLLYTLGSPWWKSLPGRALWVKSLSTLLLIDLAFLVRVLDFTPDWIANLRTLIFALIFVGVNLMLSALLAEKARRCRRETPLT